MANPNQSVKVYVKQELRLDLLNVAQRDMFRLGVIGVGQVVSRVQAGHGPNDGPAKALSGWHQRWKTKHGLKPVRDLTVTGDMLRSLSVRTVSENRVKLGVSEGFPATPRKLRAQKWVKNKKGESRQTAVTQKDKAWWNQQKEPWLVFSPANMEGIRAGGQQIAQEQLLRLVKTRPKL